MKLVSYSDTHGRQAAGLLRADGVVELAPLGFADALEFLRADEAAQKDADARQPTLRLDQVTLLAPIPRPPRIFGIGLNYADHAAESKMAVQKVPTVFMKLASAVVGPGVEVELPRASTQVDYEAELAVVIGRAGFEIAAENWERHVFGYTIMNDVSARDVQLATSQWTLGKSFRTFGPMGPCVVSRDELQDPHTLAISLEIDGERLQDSNTSLLIFRIPQLIAYISSLVELEPGDVISTGTPSGVGMGRTPQRWLRAGEEMVVRIERIGELRNRVQQHGGS